MNHSPWTPGVDVLGRSRNYSPSDELREVIWSYRKSNKDKSAGVIQHTSRSVKMTDQAIMKMMRKG